MTPVLFPIAGPWPGRLHIMSRPRGDDWLEDEAKGWRQSGLDLVVSLLEVEEAAQLGLSHQAETAQANGVGYISFPIPDRSTPNSLTAMQQLLQSLRTALLDGQNVAVHCRQSVGRAGMVAVGLLKLSGSDLESAIHAVSKARGQAVPETPEQFTWLDQLR